MENRTIYIAEIANKGIAVNCGQNGEIGKFSIVCFDSKVLKNVTKKSEGNYAVTFPNTEIKQTTIGTICRWIDRTKLFADVTTPDNALQRLASLDNDCKLRIIERCYY
jgi:hypothetical protein